MGLDKRRLLFFLCSSFAVSGRKAMAGYKTAGYRTAGYRTALLAALGVSAVALLSACDNGPSAVKQTAAGSQMATASAPERSSSSGGGDDQPKVDHRKDVVAAA